MAILITFAMLTPVKISAEDNSHTMTNRQIEYRTVVIYSNINDKDKLISDVEDAFNKYGTNTIIEVRNEENFKQLLSTTPGWVSNTAQYYIGDIFHATSGKITCYVSGSSVSNCSGTVTVYGDGITFVNKNLYNTYSTTAYMTWVLRVGNAISGFSNMSYKVKLYN